MSNTRGVALAEVYDLNPGSDSKLDNLSTRSFVQINDNVMIGGFIVAGNRPKKSDHSRDRPRAHSIRDSQRFG